MRDTRRFADRKTQAVLAAKRIACPAFDYETFARCMRYAMACGWGGCSRRKALKSEP